MKITEWLGENNQLGVRYLGKKIFVIITNLLISGSKGFPVGIPILLT